MNPVKVSTEEFLKAFFREGEEVSIRVFPDRKESDFKGQNFQIPIEKIDKFVPILKRHNEKNRGIFFVVNYGGHWDKNISRINAQFVENDTLSIEEQYKILMDFPLEPSIIVRTKKSLHSYWLIKEGEVSLFRKVQSRLIKHFSGDKSIVNESRVLRLIGFNHCKGEPVKIQCIKFNPELRYSQEELLKYLSGEDIGERAKVMRSGDKKGINLVLKRCEFLKYCKEQAAVLPEGDWYAMITNLAVFEGGSEAIHELSRPYPKYSREETEDKIQHFLQSKTRPINCRTIAERGFKCLKLQKRECSCKSPASMIYAPLDVDSLTLFLSEQPVLKNATKNAAKAAEFICEYMGLIEEVTAVAFITNDIKSHFDLKDTSVRTLIKTYRELYLKNKASKGGKPVNNTELPPWYEYTEIGVRFIPGILANHMDKNVSAFYSAEEFHLYDKGVYKEIGDLTASRIVREHLIDRYATMNGINDVLGQWQMLIYKPIEAMNSDPYIINVKNGLYHVLEDKLLEHNPNYLSTVQINANYNPSAECPQFMQFLKDCLDNEEIYLIQEILGYLLVPINKAQKSFVFVGTGNAGKSTLLSVAQEILLGNRNVSNVPWQALSDRFKTAELFGKLANIFADLPSKSIDDNGIFKSITGEDFITVEKKNKTPFSFKPYARLLFSCNDIPQNYGDRSNAFYRRLIIIRFSRPIPTEKRDVNLKEKLHSEADGILTWALEGLKRLIKNGYVFSESEKTKEELHKYRTESNSLISFVQDCCILVQGKWAELKELYRAYKQYCEEGGIIPVSQKRFSKELRENYEGLEITKDSVSRRVVFKGISVTT